jgi:hypothetical protein
MASAVRKESVKALTEYFSGKETKLKTEDTTGGPEAYELVPRSASEPMAQVAKSEERKQQATSQKLSMLRLRLKIVKMGTPKGFGLRAELRMLYGVALAVNFNAGKYTQTIGGSVNLSWSTIVQNMDGFSSLDTLFNEFFVKSLTFEFRANNKNSSNTTASASAAGSPGQLNTVGGTIYSVPHHQSAYADNGNAWYQAREVKYSKFVNLGDDWKFVAKNDEKFSWDGALGDMTTATSTMQWLTFPQVAALGGLVGVITPYLSGAAAGIGDLLENGTFGFAVVHVDVALRSRI